MSNVAERLDDGLKLVDNLATAWARPTAIKGGDLAAAVQQLTEWAYWVRESED